MIGTLDLQSLVTYLTFHGETTRNRLDCLDFGQLNPAVAHKVVSDTFWVFQLKITYNFFRRRATVCWCILPAARVVLKLLLKRNLGQPP